MTDTIGNIDERGYLNGFKRRGFTPTRCILELLANSLDALTAAGRAEDGWIRFHTGPHKTTMMDNGVGMDRTDVKNMFAMHRENHAADCSRGVSGIGAKPALSILSENGHVKIFTRKLGSDFLCVDAPWDEIHRMGRYTDMVTVRPMTDEEITAFGRETGTTIEFPNSDLLTTAICMNLNKEAPPLDRSPVVFGRDCATISYQHFESAEPTIFPKYNYFAGAESDFYKGLDVTSIDQYYHPATKQTRFIWNDGGVQKECGKAGSGIARVPAPLTEGLSGWVCKGTYTTRVGLRRDPVIFDSDEPVLPNASEKMDGLTAEVVGDHRVFNSSSKLVRNGQTIGTIPMPDMTGDSARANGRAYIMQRLLQCEVCFNPVSSHDNHMDREMQIQENKNQHQGDALPKAFLRIIKEARVKKAEQIWTYFEECVTAAAEESEGVGVAPVSVHAPVEESDNESIAASVMIESDNESISPSVHAHSPLPVAAAEEPSASDHTHTVSGADLQILMSALREKITISAEYNTLSFLVLRDALRACCEEI